MSDTKAKLIDIITLRSAINTIVESHPISISDKTQASDAVINAQAYANAVTDMKKNLRNYEFENEADEIIFFKELKPKALSHYFFWQAVSTILMLEPVPESGTIERRVQKIARQSKRLILKNVLFYSYYLSAETSQDQHYFTRLQSDFSPVYQDDGFSTGYDIILARLLSNEMLIKQLSRLMSSSTEGISANTGLTWTASKTDMIELIYSLQYSKTINEGSADIRSIADAFSKFFNVDLGDYYRTFQDIRMRKKGQSNFLDKLKERLITRLQETER